MVLHINFAFLNLESVDRGRISLSRPAVSLELVPLGNKQWNPDPHAKNMDTVPSSVSLVQYDDWYCLFLSPLPPFLQGIDGRDAPLKEIKVTSSRRFIASFNVVNTTKRDAGKYRCMIRTEGGVGISNYAELVVKGI